DGPTSEYSLGPTLPRPTNEKIDVSDVIDRVKYVDDDGEEMDTDGDDTEPSIELEGSLERQDTLGRWSRVMCSLKAPCLMVFTPEVEEHHHPFTPQVIDVTGYDVTELIDKFQGKRFVLRLDHK
ncbi:hypothetical protein ElyMa_001482400, partial [Elysia marginata]